MGGMPESLDAQLEEAAMECAALWQRATSPDSPGGHLITDGEARVIRLHDVRSFGPTALKTSHSLRAIKFISQSGNGIHGDRTVKGIKGLWRVLQGSKSDDVVPA